MISLQCVCGLWGPSAFNTVLSLYCNTALAVKEFAQSWKIHAWKVPTGFGVCAAYWTPSPSGLISLAAFLYTSVTLSAVDIQYSSLVKRWAQAHIPGLPVWLSMRQTFKKLNRTGHQVTHKARRIIDVKNQCWNRCWWKPISLHHLAIDSSIVNSMNSSHRFEDRALLLLYYFPYHLVNFLGKKETAVKDVKGQLCTWHILYSEELIAMVCSTGQQLYKGYTSYSVSDIKHYHYSECRKDKWDKIPILASIFD